jgi:acyl-coenzyme A thioesterase PaaI-like protein
LADEVASTAINGEGIARGDLSGCLFPYSIQISVNLVSNDPVGPLVAEAQVVRRGRLTIVDTTVTGSTGNVVALMRSTHMMVDPSKVGPHLKKQPG